MPGGSDPCVGVRILSAEIFMLIRELRCAEALMIIFNCHKSDISKWSTLKACLYRQASSHREFSLLNDLIQASCQEHPDQSVALIPGLSNLILRQNHVS